MKRLSRFLIMLALSLSIQAQSISYIETTKGWYYIYDQSGKRIKTISSSLGQLGGYSSNFYIIKHNSGFYVTYDATGKRLHTFSTNSVGEILNATGDTFTSRNGLWIYTWSNLFSYPRSMVSYHASFIILFCLVSFLTLHQQIINE